MILLTGEETLSRLFGLDWQLLADSCLMIIALFVLVFIVSYFLFNPARAFLQARKERIASDIENARKDREDAETLKAEYEKKLKEIDKEAEIILSDARSRALANENQILAGAREEADRIREHARREAELEKQRVADEVKKEMIMVASMIAGKVVSASIDTTVQDQLVEETLKEMGKSTWQS